MRRLTSALVALLRLRAFHFNLLLFLVLQPLSAAADAERLNVFARLKSVEGRMVSGQTALAIDTSAQAIGFGNTTKTVADFTIKPEVGFHPNINGGNPEGALVVGGLSFAGDPDLYRKQGMIYGLSAYQSTRAFYGHGRYLDASITGGHSHSFEHGIGITNTSFNACSINHMSNWWFVDVCTEKSISITQLNRSEASSQKLVLSHFYEGETGSFSQFQIGAKRVPGDGYSQNQLLLGIETVHPSGSYSTWDTALGELVANELVTRLAVSGSVSTQIREKPIQFAASYESLEGGMLLGYPRNDKRFSISASAPLWNNINATLGYTYSDSTIDYYDSATPTFGLSFETPL